MAQDNKKASVGDLVICRYDQEYFYYPGTLTPAPETGVFHMGIVLRIIEEHYMLFEREFIYEILCMDGHTRLFTQWEAEVVRSAKSS